MLLFNRPRTHGRYTVAAGDRPRDAWSFPLVSLGYASRLLPALLVTLMMLPSLAAANDALRERLAQLRGLASPSVDGVRLASVPVLDDFYRHRAYGYAWRDADQVQDLKALAALSREDGFSPSDFHIREVDMVLGGRSPSRLPGQARADAEILLSDSLLRLIHNQRFGKVDPQALDSSWNHDEGPYSNTLVRDLERALGASDLEREVLAMLRPPAFYARLKDGLAHYRTLAAAGGWTRVPEGRKLEPGMRDSRVPLLRERLRVTGEYTGGEPADPRLYDADLERAVKTFQERQTLGVDGIIGPATLAAMNVSAQQRVGQIRVNLERMRWVGDDLPADYLLVDIAAQEVELYRGGRLAWESRAIVGRAERPTPAFRDRVEYLEFNPTWTVPPTILKEDVLPKARKDPGAVGRKGLEVIDRNGNKVAPEAVNWNVSHNNLPYMLRQPPGPENALGQVKFMFPNRHSVYLHDTPSRSLFKKSQRTFSSGCVRVDRPLELAEILLDDPKWNQKKFQSLLQSKRPATVRLKQSVPVILSYWTAEADENGVVHFREDIYSRDVAVLAALDGTGSVRVVYTESEPPVATAPPARLAEAKPEPVPRPTRTYGIDLPGEGPLFSF